MPRGCRPCSWTRRREEVPRTSTEVDRCPALERRVCRLSRALGAALRSPDCTRLTAPGSRSAKTPLELQELVGAEEQERQSARSARPILHRGASILYLFCRRYFTCNAISSNVHRQDWLDARHRWRTPQIRPRAAGARAASSPIVITQPANERRRRTEAHVPSSRASSARRSTSRPGTAPESAGADGAGAREHGTSARASAEIARAPTSSERATAGRLRSRDLVRCQAGAQRRRVIVFATPTRARRAAGRPTRGVRGPTGPMALRKNCTRRRDRACSPRTSLARFGA